MNFKKLIEYLAINNGQKTKYDGIAEITSLSYTEVLNHIEVLKETYLINVLKPFFTNKNKELVKIPKIYFIDNGVRNFFVNNFNFLNLREDRGFLFEGYVISELIKSGLNQEKIKFWQDKNKHEVDLLIDEIKTQIPIEVKFKTDVKTDDLIGLTNFLKEYSNIKKAYLLNLSNQKRVKNISFILPFKISDAIFRGMKRKN